MHKIGKTEDQTERVTWFKKIIKNIADIVDLEIIGEVKVKDKKTGETH